MTTLPTQRRGSGAGWLIPTGMLVLAAGIAALIGTGNEDVVNWIKDNSSCNERPCTYDEAKEILLVGGVVGTGSGSFMILVGLWRVLRSRDAGPTLPAPAPAPPDYGDDRAEGPVVVAEADRGQADPGPRRGYAERPRGDTAGERLAALDALLAEGKLDLDDYKKMRSRILKRM